MLVTCRKYSIFLLVTSFQQVFSVEMRKLTKLRLICKPRFGKSEVAKGSFFFFLLLTLLPCLLTDTLVYGKGKKRRKEKKNCVAMASAFPNLSPVKSSCARHEALLNLVKFLYTQVSLPISERFFPSGIG